MTTTKIFVPWLAAIALLTGFSAAKAETLDTISVSGLGQVAIEPNMAVVEAAVVTEAKTVRDAQQLNAKIFNEAIDGLRVKFQIADKDLQSTGYTISPVYDDHSNGTRVLRGYSVRHSLKVAVRKLSDLGVVVDLMGTSGINQLNLIRFSHSDKKTFEMQALTLAMDDARGKADIIARQTGRTISKVMKVDYHSLESPESVVRGEALAEKADATEFIPGEIVMRAGVMVDYGF